MQPRNLLTQWARLLIESLVEAGVTDAVVSPGSRSTPFTIQALRAPGLTCHSVIDERSAGFFALGLARVTGRPPLLLCTSGSAGAHYLPAVIEASESRIPLLVLTADRPFELLDCAAPQTIDQTHLFGRYARRFVDLGNPTPSAEALAAVRRKASQAVFTARWPLAGAVHLNAHAAKPLEPVGVADLADATPAEHALEARVAELLASPVPRAHAPHPIPDPRAVALLLERLMRCKRGLIVVGRREPWLESEPSAARGAAEAPASAEHALLTSGSAPPWQLAERSGLPLLLEAPSQLRLEPRGSDAVVIDAIESVLRVAWPPKSDESDGALPLPDFVLELGAPLTSGAWANLAARLPRGVRHVVSDAPWPDPQNNLAELIVADPWAVAAELARGLRSALPAEPEGNLRESLEPATVGEARSAWRSRLEQLNRMAWSTVEAALEASSESVFSEPCAVRTLVESLPRGSLLALGNSLPIREVDWVCPTGTGDVTVLVQRGANGIDGLIAGATGAAVASRKPTCLLIGDVSALHDIGSLALARSSPVPLVIAVLDNGGGRIFHLLPFAAQGTQSPEQWRYWATPPEIDFAAAAQTFGLRYAACQNSAELRRALTSAFESASGATLLHLRVATGSAQEFLANLPELPPKRLPS